MSPLTPPLRSTSLRAFFATVLVAGLAVGVFTGCDALDVDNPNSLREENLSSPTSATALRNGSVATTARAYSYMIALYGTASDELTWIGSFDAWNQVDRGRIANPLNQFLELAFPFVGEARYMSDKAISELETFQDEGTLQNPENLAVAYQHGALTYLLIGDMYERFAFSAPNDPAPAIDPAEMDTLYTAAITYLDNGLAIAREQSYATLEAKLLATRARAKHGRAVWRALHGEGPSSNGFVAADGAADDAEAVLDLIGQSATAQYAMEYGPSSIDNYAAGQVNQRDELAVESAFTDLTDPVSGEPDPRAAALVDQFTAGPYPPQPYTSAAEMRLILAETALADDRPQDAASWINEQRAIDDLPAYDPESSPLSTAEMLRHERKANLFMMGRRLHDLYRFGLRASNWEDNSVAAESAGTVFPISNTEIESNPEISR
jgi:hypothetical protein